MTFTIEHRNEALRSGKWQGVYQTLLEADTRAKELAERSQAFATFQVCEGSPKNPGKQIGPQYRGKHGNWEPRP